MASHTVPTPPERTSSTTAFRRFTTPTPRLPEGVRFYQVSGFADTTEAYEALTERHGWTEVTHEGQRWKQRPHRDGRVVVHPPTSRSGVGS